VVAVAVIAYAVGGGGKSDKNTAAGGQGEIFLEAASATGASTPFTESVAAPTPSSTVATTPPVTSGGGGTAISTTRGGAPGLYGGTRSLSSCDPEKLVTFLETNPALGRAWAAVQGIPPSEIRSYVATLTPVILRSDTRVTNHGYRNGRATAHQSVLQAGTAVLVDQYGVPRVRCFCGNPLLPPVASRQTPTYTGAKWEGFKPANTTVIVQNTTVINTFVLVNVVDGLPFERVKGTDVTKDADTKINVPGITTTTTPTPQDVSGAWVVSATFTGGAEGCTGETGTDIAIKQTGSAMHWTTSDGSLTGTVDRAGNFSITDDTSGIYGTYTGRFVIGAGGRLELTGTGTLNAGGETCNFAISGYLK
jgi:hypothetical protein